MNCDICEQPVYGTPAPRHFWCRGNTFFILAHRAPLGLIVAVVLLLLAGSAAAQEGLGPQDKAWISSALQDVVDQQVAAMDARLDNQSTLITALAADLDAAQAQIQALQAQLAAAQNQSAAIDAQVVGLAGNLTAVAVQQEAAEARYNGTLAAATGRVEATVKDNAVDLAPVMARMASLEDQQVQVQSSIMALDADQDLTRNTLLGFLGLVFLAIVKVARDLKGTQKLARQGDEGHPARSSFMERLLEARQERLDRRAAARLQREAEEACEQAEWQAQLDAKKAASQRVASQIFGTPLGAEAQAAEARHRQEIHDETTKLLGLDWQEDEQPQTRGPGLDVEDEPEPPKAAEAVPKPQAKWSDEEHLGLDPLVVAQIRDAAGVA